MVKPNQLLALPLLLLPLQALQAAAPARPAAPGRRCPRRAPAEPLLQQQQPQLTLELL